MYASGTHKNYLNNQCGIGSNMWKNGLSSLASDSRKESAFPVMNSLTVKVFDNTTNKMWIYFLDKGLATSVNVAAAWKHVLKYWKGLLVIKLYGFQF